MELAKPDPQPYETTQTPEATHLNFLSPSGTAHKNSIHPLWLNLSRSAATTSSSVALLRVSLELKDVVALIGALPRWGYSGGWGYGPSGILGLVLVVVLILVLLGRV